MPNYYHCKHGYLKLSDIEDIADEQMKIVRELNVLTKEKMEELGIKKVNRFTFEEEDY